MKVSVKRGEYQSIIPAAIVTMMFFNFGGGFVIFFFGYFSMYPSFAEFMSLFSEMGFGFLVGFVFFMISLYFIYYFIKRPKKYPAKLLKCDIEEYKGEKICNYTFRLKKGSKCPFRDFKCYTYNESDFNLVDNYLLLIKEVNWKVKEVLLDTSEVVEEKIDPLDETSPISGFVYVLYAFFFIFGGMLLFCIVNIIYCLSRNASISGNFIVIAFALLFLIPSIKSYKGLLISSKSINDQVKIDTKNALRMLRKAEFTMKDEEFNGGIDLDLSSVDEFTVLRNKYEDNTEYVEVVDINNNVLYRVIRGHKLHKYFIKNRNDCVEGKIKLNRNYEHNEVLIKPMNKKVYYIGNRSDVKYNYLLVGLDYKLKKVNKKVFELYEQDRIIARLEFYIVNYNIRLKVSLLEKGMNNESIVFSSIAVYMMK